MLLTQWFDPEPTFKGLLFARALVKRGFDVEVVTGFPNYPGGQVYPGYKVKWIQREVIEGVKITRLPLYPNHGQSSIKRILNYSSFAGSALMYGLFFAQRPDVIYAYHPPLTVGITAVILRAFKKVPVVYDIQDMWPDTLRATSMVTSERTLRLVGKVCSWVYRYMDHIVVLSSGFKSLLVERSVPAEKISVIHNWSDEVALQSTAGSAPDELIARDDTFSILFAGNMGKAQALEAVVEAAQITSEQSPQVRFVFVGGGIEVENLKKKTAALGLGNVSFLPAVPMSEVGSLLQKADALLVHLRKDPLFEITIPSKTQAYMAVGKPILMAVDGDAANLVRKAECGVIAESENAQSIANAAKCLSLLSLDDRKSMGDKSREFYKKFLSLDVGLNAFSQLFISLAKNKDK